MAASAEQLKELARGVVLAQGNVFIKDLLRSKGLPVGGAKAELLERMETAIDDGVLTQDDFEQWLSQVEGWGHFHVYPFQVPDAIRTRRRWQPARVEQRIAGTPLGDAWDAPSSLAFPDELSLTHASLTDRRLRLTWHQGVEWRRRAPQMDHREVIEDEIYEFDAYQVRHERKVVRFVLGLDEGVAAALVPYRLTDNNHADALDQVWDGLEPIVDKGELSSFPVSRIITRADRQQLQGGDRLTTKLARLEAEDAWVEFGTSGEDGGYADVDAVRQVRHAAGGVGFRGGRATFLYAVDDGARNIHVGLSGHDRRVWLPAQVEEEQVWSLLTILQAFA